MCMVCKILQSSFERTTHPSTMEYYGTCKSSPNNMMEVDFLSRRKELALLQEITCHVRIHDELICDKLGSFRAFGQKGSYYIRPSQCIAGTEELRPAGSIPGRRSDRKRYKQTRIGWVCIPIKNLHQRSLHLESHVAPIPRSRPWLIFEGP